MEETGFIVDAAGPEPLVGVFEDSGETGDLYVFDNAAKKILAWVQVYVRSQGADVGPEDVEVVWSEGSDKVAAKILGGVRAVIRVSDGATMRSPISEEWLSGFEV